MRRMDEKCSQATLIARDMTSDHRLVEYKGLLLSGLSTLEAANSELISAFL